jgi:lambda family phage minor tail protein L
MLPRRQVVQNVCAWRYRSAECGYTGGAVADINDQPTTDPARDQCGKRLASCKLRFGQYAELPFGGFPAAGLIR